MTRISPMSARPFLERLEDRTLLTTGWLFGLGGTAAETGQTSTVDAAGNLYLSGSFNSATVDFDPGPGTFNLTNSHGDRDAFLAKYSPSGTLLWARALGAVGDDITWRAVLDAAGNIYAVGWGSATDFGDGISIGPGASSWLAKFDGATGTPLWAAGFSNTNSTELGMDAAGNVYVTGAFSGTIDFDPGPGVYNLTSGPGQDSFLLSLSPSGNFLNAWRVGGFYGNILAIDGGSVYVVGSFNGTEDFDPGSGTRNLTSAGGYDIFLASYTTNGTLNWAQSMGGALDEIVFNRGKLSLDATTLTLFWEFQGTADFDPGPGVSTLTSAGEADIVVARYARSTGALEWAKRIGGTGVDYVQRGSGDPAGTFYVAGQFANTVDFDLGAGTVNLTATAGSQDGFLLQLDASGNYITVRQFAGPQRETVKFAGFVGGLAYVTGWFENKVTFPGGGVLTSAGDLDAFVIAFDPLTAVVQGTVVNNLNNDLTLNDGAGVFGSTVYLDLNNNASFDANEPNATTDRWGGYQIAGLAPGTYTVRQIPLAGWTQTTPASSYTVTLTAGQVVTGLDFGNHIPVTVRTYNSPNVPRSIPSRGTITSTLTISDSYPIYDVNVKLSISHKTVDHLDVFLIAPDGTRIELFTDVGGSGDNFTNTTLDDEDPDGIASGSAPFTGSFRPEGFLGLLDNLMANGIWTLEITDDTSGITGSLLSWSLIITGPTSGGSPLTAAGRGPGTGAGVLTLDRVASLLREASARWRAAGADTAPLAAVQVHITNLGGTTLGLAWGNTIWLDDDAAGWGWFVDATPSDDSEFTTPGDQGEQGRMDLLSVLMHELGHLLGHDHDEEGVMHETLAAGVRTLPTAGTGLLGDWVDAWLVTLLDQRERPHLV